MDFDQIFKAYDVRGIYHEQIDEKRVYRIVEAYAAVRKPKKIVVGRDVRVSGEALKQELIAALIKCGVDVVDIGVITTDQLYFAVGKYGYDGGISVTASHNPGEYNGLKFSGFGGAPITSRDLEALRDWAASDNQSQKSGTGEVSSKDIIDDYIEHVISYIKDAPIKPFKVVTNANFGAVGRVLDKIAEKLNLNLVRLNWEEDGLFPKGPPNPLLPANRDETISLIMSSSADLGVAWDADADRVFLFTGDGVFIPSCYIIALLSSEFLHEYPGSKIVHDITAAWVMDNSIKASGGIPIINRTGHTFMKARMRQEDAPFAGESSGHYYFRDSYYADNGLVPFLIILKLISETGQTLKQLVEPLMSKYIVSGELNFTVKDTTKSLKLIEAKYSKQGTVDKTDGLVVDNDNWRFSVRPSNTEPLFRFNAEAYDKKVLDKLVLDITKLINT